MNRKKNMYKYITKSINLYYLINTVANFKEETVIKFER